MLIYVDFDSMLAIVCKGWQFRSPVTPGSSASSSSGRRRLAC